MACAHGNVIKRGTAPAPCGCSSPAPSLEELLADIRGSGWSVAVHNDYKLDGRSCTFWLFTHPNGRWLKAEGATDAAAVAEIWTEALAR